MLLEINYPREAIIESYTKPISYKNYILFEGKVIVCFRWYWLYLGKLKCKKMISKRTFKNIIILKMLTWFALIPLALFEEHLYPSNEQEADFDLFSVYLICSVVALFTHYFLYKFKQIGKTLYLPLLIISLFTIFDMETYDIVYTPLAPFYELFEYLASVADGIIFSILYFTSIKKEFE